MRGLNHLGFTGTQAGMTEKQRQALASFLASGRAVTFHHGDCVGSDEQADLIARTFGCSIVIHPPTNMVKRAFCDRAGGTVLEPKPYLDRNRDIVDACDLLLATPKSMAEELRSGTWFTVRYARKIGRALLLLWPEGGWTPEGRLRP